MQQNGMNFPPQYQHMMQQQYRMYAMPQMMGGKGMGPMGMGMGGKGQMPPVSNYVAPQKQENPEFAGLRPGEAKTFRGYNPEIPISEKGSAMMAMYERVMQRPQGSFPNAYSSTRNAKKSDECHFHNTPQGCRNGASCQFSHTENSGSGPKFGKSKTKCRNLPNCVFGAKCRFLH